MQNKEILKKAGIEQTTENLKICQELKETIFRNNSEVFRSFINHYVECSPEPVTVLCKKWGVNAGYFRLFQLGEAGTTLSTIEKIMKHL